MPAAKNKDVVTVVAVLKFAQAQTQPKRNSSHTCTRKHEEKTTFESNIRHFILGNNFLEPEIAHFNVGSNLRRSLIKALDKTIFSSFFFLFGQHLVQLKHDTAFIIFSFHSYLSNHNN